MDAILKPVGYGLLIGALFSLSLGVHSKSTATGITHTLFGMTSSQLLNYIVIVLTVFSLVVASAFSILIQDLKYPNEHPVKFTIETLAVSFFPALIIFIIVFLRGKQVTKLTIAEYLALAVKFGLIHILFQFSGVYSAIGL